MQAILLSRRRALVGALLLVAALVFAGRHLARAGASTASTPLQTIAAVADGPPPKLVVHVVGAVRRPGLYRIADGSRTADAVKRAGGPTAKADLALVNLAAPVADGVQVLIPRRAPAGTPPARTDLAAAPGPVRLSTATLEQLDSLPGVGPVTAQKILDYRQKHGAFASVDELDAVPGIGPARLEQLREAVTP